MQYEVLQAAPEDAASPKEDDVVKVHYHGTLVDGSVFDSSVERGEPVSFPVKGVIKGWVEALQLMKVGDKFTLFNIGAPFWGLVFGFAVSWLLERKDFTSGAAPA